ncbi:MAG: cob(I)yrinic acid a,c-diamide adenosyltransferase [Coriobacteriia bacterium]|nr:cob(I)yrinic acid a,c-diamide adenosyltransferase [Coriobacteriia bacterium]
MATIYTRGGDDGTTSLAGGDRIAKDAPAIELLGALDEANSLIGLARVNVVGSDVDDALAFVQQRLLNCGAAVAGASGVGVAAEDVTALEAAIDRFASKAGGFAGFVLPGCDEASARLHVARTVIRRAERAAARANAAVPLPPNVLPFLNRAGDLLYVAARYAGAGNECRWDPDAPRP